VSVKHAAMVKYVCQNPVNNLSPFTEIVPVLGAKRFSATYPFRDHGVDSTQTGSVILTFRQAIIRNGTAQKLWVGPTLKNETEVQSPKTLWDGPTLKKLKRNARLLLIAIVRNIATLVARRR
jgi:hypothetical protein